MAQQAPGRQGADEAEERQLTAADRRRIWADRHQSVCDSGQSHQPGGARVHRDDHSIQEQLQLKGRVSIPDLLNLQGQVARCYAETCFHKFVTDNLQRPRELSQQDLIKEFKELKLNLRQGFVSTGMGDLKTKLLTVAEAKKRKSDADTQRKKQQKLMQADQPEAIECTA
ncbi:TPA: hypothetical protein ACH3X1_010994 [Trebouxia sp. C0004]